jgi:hypothetical protein
VRRRTLAQILLRESARFGIHVSRRGDRLILTPPGKCPDDLRELLREHKAQILDLLEAEEAGLRPDCAPWLHVAKQVLLGEFDKADSSTRESLVIGLRNIEHPTCRAAHERLTPKDA